MIRLSDSVRYNKQAAFTDMEVRNVTYTLVRENWIHRDRFLFTEEMIYLKKGTLYLNVNGISYTLHAGSFFIIHRYSKIYGELVSDGLCEFYTIAFDTNLARIFALELCELSVSGSAILIEEIFKRLYDGTDFSAAQTNRYDVLMMMLVYEIEALSDKSTDAKPLMQKTMEYINAHISAPITVDDVCAYLNYNRDYISKQFLSYHGITIKRYIDSRRIAIAKQLLLTSKMSLSQIADELGFENAQQFYKFFKYHEKISPSDYRAQNR